MNPTEPIIRALLVEDDARLAELTRKYLEKHNVVATIVSDGSLGLKEAIYHDYDVVLLDLMLPGMDGIQVCQKLRERKPVPILMLTARGEEADRVFGLEVGADDYLTKPFSPRELLARIRAVLRRTRGQLGHQADTLLVSGLRLEPGARTAALDGRELDLTSYEFALLYALATNAGRVLSREHLMDLAKGSADESFDRSVDVHVSRLRKKLGDKPSRPRFIRTVRGVGYLFLARDAGQDEEVLP